MTFVKDLNPEPLKSSSQRKRVNSVVLLKIDDEVLHIKTQHIVLICCKCCNVML